MSMTIKHNKFEPIYKIFRDFCHSVSCSGSWWREKFSCHRKYPWQEYVYFLCNKIFFLWHEVFFVLLVTGNLFPVRGNLFPVTGNLVPVTGNLFPVTGNLFLVTGNLYPVTGIKKNTSCHKTFFLWKKIYCYRKFISYDRK